MAHETASEASVETVLRDGTDVLLRPVQPEDKEKFVEGMARLSTRSRYLRFHTGVEQLSERQLRYLTEVDQERHVAWVAIDLDADDHPGIGVARFIRLDDEPAVAEAAITVLDDYQGRGLGTLLLGQLAASAVRRGVRVFRSYVLGENQAMLELFDDLGAERSQVSPDVWQVDLRLPERSTDLEGTAPHQVFRAVTGRQLPPMRTTAPPVWMGDRRRGGEDAERPMLREWLDRMLGGQTERPR
jgi:RimJ/RimL family protein N-acetyltransferase